MDMNEYQRLSRRTMPDKIELANYTLGLTGESGEVADLIKKLLYHDHPITLEEIEKELGDVLHYVSGIASMLNLSLEQIARNNIKKLERRYPDGFSKEASINREE